MKNEYEIPSLHRLDLNDIHQLARETAMPVRDSEGNIKPDVCPIDFSGAQIEALASNRNPRPNLNPTSFGFKGLPQQLNCEDLEQYRDEFQSKYKDGDTSIYAFTAWLTHRDNGTFQRIVDEGIELLNQGHNVFVQCKDGGLVSQTIARAILNQLQPIYAETDLPRLLTPDGAYRLTRDERPSKMNQLIREGYIVIPTPLAKKNKRREAVQQFDQMLVEHKEFLNPDLNDPDWKPVLGGFAALGTPTSFHHPWIRAMREKVLAHAIDEDVLPYANRNLEKPFDRVTFRRKGQKPTEESVHRDEAKTAQLGDDVFGGWLNLDDEDQIFTAVPRTHFEQGLENKGFATLKKNTYEFEAYSAELQRIAIPPGHLLIFYERLVHSVTSSTARRDMRRIHCGFRLTFHDSPLFEDTSQWISQQAAPRIKSGQWPPLYPSNYTNFSRLWQPLTDWSMKTFVPELLYTHVVTSNNPQFNGRTYVRVGERHDGRPSGVCRSLEFLGKKWPDYSVEEKAVLKPQRKWKLKTFENGGNRRMYEID